MRPYVLPFALLLVLAGGCRDGLGVPDSQRAPVACSTHLDSDSCDAQPGCVASGCPTCDSDDPISFHGCYEQGHVPPESCPPIACTEPDPCGARKTDDHCEGNDNACASVFVDPGICDCFAPGCCAKFDRCIAPPQQNQCLPSTVGADLPCPFFGGCPPGFEQLYDGACAVGCVRHPHCEIAED